MATAGGWVGSLALSVRTATASPVGSTPSATRQPRRTARASRLAKSSRWPYASDGFATILTSGQKSSCRLGAELIGELRRRAAGRIEILVGAGVDAAAVRELRPVTGCRSFHMSGKVTLESGMTFRREGVPMGIPGMDEFSVWRTDAARIRAAKEALSCPIANA